MKRSTGLCQHQRPSRGPQPSRQGNLTPLPSFSMAFSRWGLGTITGMQLLERADPGPIKKGCARLLVPADSSDSVLLARYLDGKLLRHQLRRLHRAAGAGLLDGELSCGERALSAFVQHGPLCWKLGLTISPHAFSLQTKNVTGRLLVGLRWWNEANDTGSAWRFETLPQVMIELSDRARKRHREGARGAAEPQFTVLAASLINRACCGTAPPPPLAHRACVGSFHARSAFFGRRC